MHSVNFGKITDVEISQNIFEQILNTEQNDYNNLDEHLQMLLGEYYEPFKIVSDFEKMDKVQARMPYIIKIK